MLGFIIGIGVEFDFTAKFSVLSVSLAYNLLVLLRLCEQFGKAFEVFLVTVFSADFVVLNPVHVFALVILRATLIKPFMISTNTIPIPVLVALIAAATTCFTLGGCIFRAAVHFTV